MQPLEKSLRNQLERTIKQAREIGEAAGRAALGQLGVGDAVAFEHLSDDEKDLRRRLRVHGRQLGDSLNGGKVQTMDRLVEEVAYEHWHRMLFARFLAENDLLMYEDVAITLEECEELAQEEGAANGWELASRLAGRMLPQIFRQDSPVFQLHFAANHQLPLEKLLADLPREVFTASDSLGWVYQFWQAKRKDEVNASEVKIGARELPAVTQLFTEPYMVSFLLDNSLGAWWAARRLTEADLKNAQNEEELRRKAAIPGVPLEYLRFVQQEDSTWTPAAGIFDGWPEQLADLKTLDPCCGSGHFLVAAFLMLVPMRMERDGLSAREAVEAVLRENIHGLELDQRCVELAAFALALTAWKYPNAGGYRVLPELNVACSGLAISAKKEEWLALAGDNTNLRIALEELYKQFKDAPVLGSLINPEASLGKGSLFEMKWEKVEPLLNKALPGQKDDETSEMAVVAKGLAKSANLLRRNYAFVFTNVPYLTQKRQTQKLKEMSSLLYPDSRADLATIFLSRCLDFLAEFSTVSLVIPMHWLYLGSYTKLRNRLLMESTFNCIGRLGTNAFETIKHEIVNCCLAVISNCHPQKDQNILSLDASVCNTAQIKAKFLISGKFSLSSQLSMLQNPDFRITHSESGGGKLLSEYAICTRGTIAGDTKRWTRSFWEVSDTLRMWKRYQGPPEGTRMGNLSDDRSLAPFFDGLDSILDWRTQGEGMQCAGEINPALGKLGVAVGQMGSLPTSIYTAEFYSNSVAPIVPHNESLLPAIYTYLRDQTFYEQVRLLDQKINVTNATFIKVPFDRDHWTKVAEERYPHGLPKPFTDDPAQWIFHGHPCGSVIWDEEQKWTAHGAQRTDESVLHVAAARLLGYRWPAELDAGIELADEQREWVKRCEALLPYADDDGIVCIPPVRGEAAASDRLLNLLAAAYGDTWSNDTLAALLKSADHAGKTLETWLREKFFTQHCKLFQHRPFIWHIWDGLRDGFSALINYHQLDNKLLQTLTYTYLGDWISRQKQDIANGLDGAQERLAAAEGLKERLELILEGEAPYDIFVRWKPLEEQPVGWNPDLNDGVRLNIRPFLSVPDVGKRGAGVLRDKPNIHWNKDRGQDVASAPWYHQFGGDRINDHHLTLDDKSASKEKKEIRK